jgi:hypothetical protein
MITIQPMVDTFTLNQLVRYTYNECSPTESQLIEEFADSDCDIANEIKELREARKGLPKASVLSSSRHYPVNTGLQRDIRTEISRCFTFCFLLHQRMVLN